jgi:hypothetical protein
LHVVNNLELLKVKEVDFQKLPENYFQDLPLEVQEMLVEYDSLFVLLIPNLHSSIKNNLSNLKNTGMF